jgi:hypothetical protein
MPNRSTLSLVQAAQDVLPVLQDEVEQRKWSGNDEYWQGLDAKAATLSDALNDVLRDVSPPPGLIDAVRDVLHDLQEELEKARSGPGRDELWQTLAAKVATLSDALAASSSPADPTPIPADFAALWDAVSEVIEDPDSGLSDKHHQALVKAVEGIQRQRG